MVLDAIAAPHYSGLYCYSLLAMELMENHIYRKDTKSMMNRTYCMSKKFLGLNVLISNKSSLGLTFVSKHYSEQCWSFYSLKWSSVLSKYLTVHTFELCGAFLHNHLSE